MLPVARVLATAMAKAESHFNACEVQILVLQGTIIENDFNPDAEWTVTVRLHPGYPVPDKGHKVVCFNPQTGEMIPQYQVRFVEVEDMGNGVIKLTFEANYTNQYKPEFENANAVGNFICLEVRHG